MTIHDVDRRLQAWSVWYRCRRQDSASFTAEIQAVERAVARLGDIQREVIRCVYLDRRTRFDIARRLDIHVERVPSVQVSALEVLLNSLEVADAEVAKERRRARN